MAKSHHNQLSSFEEQRCRTLRQATYIYFKWGSSNVVELTLQIFIDTFDNSLFKHINNAILHGGTQT